MNLVKTNQTMETISPTIKQVAIDAYVGHFMTYQQWCKKSGQNPTVAAPNIKVFYSGTGDFSDDELEELQHRYNHLMKRRPNNRRRRRRPRPQNNNNNNESSETTDEEPKEEE